MPITQDNLDVVLDAGWIDQATLCQGVEAGTVAGVRRCSGFGSGGHARRTCSRRHRVDGHGAGDDGRLTALTLACACVLRRASAQDAARAIAS